MALAICGAAAAFAEPEYAADVPQDILTPDTVETRLGTLEFFDGLPSDETASLAYDALDLARGLTIFMDGIPAASTYAFCHGLTDAGLDGQSVGIFEDLYNARSLLLTPNTTTVYVTFCTDLEAGPIVVEAPAGVLGFVDDIYMRHIVDVGFTGPDGGEGGKYLIVPPGWDGDLPDDGYFIAQAPSYMNWFLVRAFVGDAGREAAVDGVKQTMRIYPWAERDAPPETTFVNLTDKKFNTIHANNFRFYEEMKAIVDKEPVGALPLELQGALASVGIRKGEPFDPDPRLRATLEEAVALGNAAARSLVYAPRERTPFYYDDRNWKTAFVGGSHEFLSDDGRLLDARSLFHYYATAITPAMVAAIPGKGSQYALADRDSEDRYLDGSKVYSVTIPPDVPAKDYWSFVVYDTQTRSLLETDQKLAGVDSNSSSIEANADGSYTVWFAPQPPEGKEGNWIQTMPGKPWTTVLRLYGPLEPWFDGTWKPGDIELVE